LWHAALILTVAAIAAGCAARSVSWDRPPVAIALPSRGPVFVMAPIITATGGAGNVGTDFAAVRASVAERMLAIVKERFPDAAIADTRTVSRLRLDAYRSATAESTIAPEELAAAAGARSGGATHLLVATISEWKQMRTDDPVGAVVLPHNRVTVTLRLMQLDPPALSGRVTFHNQARLTLNQQAIGLLDGNFERAILKLMTG